MRTFALIAKIQDEKFDLSKCYAVANLDQPATLEGDGDKVTLSLNPFPAIHWPNPD